jgi:hypothetical protein
MQNESAEVWLERFAALDANYFYAAGLLVLLCTLALNVRVINELTRARATLAQKPPEPGTTPSHVVFSDKLLGIPLLPGLLNRPLWVKNPTSDFSRFTRRDGDWVNRGDALIEFVLVNRIFFPPVIARVRSPVSGRVVFTNSLLFESGAERDPEWSNFLCVIEIPRGEWVPATMDETFGHFCDALWDYRQSVLQKSRDNSFPIHPDEVIKRELAALTSRAPAIIPKNAGLYRERIDSLNLYHPRGIGSPLNLAAATEHASA